MLRYLLLGRTGSGCSFFEKLAEEQGITVAHDDAIVGYYMHEEIENAQIIPIRPNDIEEICKEFPDDVFRIIMITASNEDRRIHAIANADNKLFAEADFLDLCEAENAAFDELENKIKNAKLNIANINEAEFINNDFTDSSDIFGCAKMLPAYFREFDRMCVIVEECKRAGTFKTVIREKDGAELVRVYLDEKNADGAYYEDVSTSRMAEYILTDSVGIKTIMREWLKIKDTCFNNFVHKDECDENCLTCSHSFSEERTDGDVLHCGIHDDKIVPDTGYCDEWN